MASGVSETDIYNRALTKLGSSTIVSTTDDVERVRVLNSMYSMIRDEVLRNHPWNFSTKRVVLALDGTAPAWKWKKRYQLPTDFHLLLEIKDCPDYNIEDNFILTDEGDTISIRYIYRNETTSHYDAIFNEALATKLAVEACMRITRSNTIKDSLKQDYANIIADAKFRDGFEDDTQEPPDDDWVLARL